MRTHYYWIFGLTCSLMALGGQSAAQSFNYVSIDVPCSAFPSGAPCPASGYAAVTAANGINAAGDIVGNYTDGNNVSHGFLLRDGQFSTIDVDFPWAAFTLGAYGISSGGDIVGRYRAQPNTAANPDSPQYCDGTPACLKGFLYHSQTKKFVTVLNPGHPGAFAQRITPNGDIYGCLHNHDLGGSMYSAIWLRSGENHSMIPGEGELTDPTLGLPMSMNNGATPDGKTIVGHYTDMTKHIHGFVVQDGALQQPPPMAACYDLSGIPCYDVPFSTLTQIWDINPGQQFVGTYKDSSGHQHGLLQLPDGSAPIQLDYPGASATIAFGINPDGVIVGQYSAGGYVHGFAAVPAN
jgi:probable HAF family extracellular repeat protein